ncbi:MAG: peptidoglycan DD-metalloendopeptidase family protein [Waterburya sp.]
MVKLANNTYFQLGVFMSSAMVGQTIGLNQPTQALELNNLLMPQLANVEKNGANKTNYQNNFVQPPQSPIFSPQSFNLIAFSLRSKSVDSPIKSDNFKLVAPLSQSKQINSTFNNQELYLANTQSFSKPSSLVYQVKKGDTITKIASRYQIPSHELIKLNQIQDSNFIFVDQRLQIPLTEIKNHHSDHEAIAKLNSGIIPSKSKVDNSSQLKTTKAHVISSVDSTSIEDPYIANLRAEIEQLQEQNPLQDAAQNTSKQQPQVIDNSDTASLVSITKNVTKEQPVQRAKSNSLKSSATSFSANLIKESSLALKLPPLPSSQAYLPNIFDGYAWPAKGVLTSGYGLRWGRMHEGIDIAAPIGTPILAAAAGVVTGSGWHEGYGNLVKLEHLDGSVTLYAHNNRNLVTHGQQVKQGEQIAEMGNTGRSTGSHLHFEIHLRNEQIVDPLTLLSSR